MEQKYVRTTGPGKDFTELPHRPLLESQWWVIAFHGVLAILFGALFLARPGSTLRSLVYVFGIWTLLDGISSLSAARRGEPELVLEGLIGIAIGCALIFFLPRISGDVLFALIATWAMVTGILRLVRSARFPSSMRNEVWLVVSGIVSIAFGVLMLRQPHVALPLLALWIGVFAIFLGVSLIAASIHLRNLATVRV